MISLKDAIFPTPILLFGDEIAFCSYLNEKHDICL